MLFATSCQNEDEFGGAAGNTSNVTFSIGTPEISTRAFSDGATATVLQYAVYDAAGNELTNLTKIDGTINGSTTVNLQLATGNEYSVIFWAAAPDAPYTVDFTNKTMTVDYDGALSNDENRDAFYKYHTFTVKGNQTETIELKRPFAQLNIGTNDYAAASDAGYNPTKSYVKVSKIYNTLNFADGTIAGEVDAIFGYNNIPTTETFPVAGYDYLAMNYLLVAADKALVDVEFRYTKTDETAAKTRTVGSVPVQRNYRTNLYGQLITSDVDINVEINPDYNEPSNEADALHKAALNGGEITLTEDVVLTATLEVVGNMTINLNGKTISANIHKSVGSVIKNNGTLTINGGTISSLAENGGSAIMNNGTLVVNDAILNGAINANGSWPSYAVNNTGVATINNSTITSYHGGVASYGDDAIVTLNNTDIDMEGIPGFTSHGIYTYNNGKVVVNGGNIANKATDQNASGASVINGAVTVNSGNFTGRIENYYGTPVLKGGIFSVEPKANFIAAGYKAIEKDGKYYVVADEIDVVATNDDELRDAIENQKAESIQLCVGEYTIDLYDSPSNWKGSKTLTIKGVEGTKVGFAEGNVCLNLFDALTIENCEIMHMATKAWGMLVFSSSNNASGVYTVSNCTFKGVRTQGIFINENTSNAVYNIQNCTFNGNFGTEGAITIQTNKDVNHIVNVNGCTFNNIPATSHRIFLTKSSAGLFYDFTLNTDLAAASAYDIATFAALGFTSIDLEAGEYDVYGCAGKTLTLNGSNDAVIILKNEGEDGCDYAFGGNGTGVGNITFNGITINTTQNTGNYKGFAYMKGTFNNCNFVGAYSLNNANDFEFNNCTFDFQNGYFWTWGANSVTFNACTFNGNTKNILAHGYASTVITINDCAFAATEVGKTGDGYVTACVEIDPAGTNTYTINFTGNNTKTDKYAGWKRVKDDSTGHTINGI